MRGTPNLRSFKDGRHQFTGYEAGAVFQEASRYRDARRGEADSAKPFLKIFALFQELRRAFSLLAW